MSLGLCLLVCKETRGSRAVSGSRGGSEVGDGDMPGTLSSPVPFSWCLSCTDFRESVWKGE